MERQGKLRSGEQLRLYHGLVRQLVGLKEVKVQVEGELFKVRLAPLKEPRYLLKALDLDLPTTNPRYPQDPNKNRFSHIDQSDLTHHIAWLRELLWDNGEVPFDEKDLINV